MGAAGVLTASGGLVSACHKTPHPDAKNVLLIVADDMRYDHLQFMPNVQDLIAAQGRTFTQARCNVALCQPSRVGFLTGQLSKHNHEVEIGFFGTELNDHTNTVPGWMSQAGYHCAHVGKYVNGIDAAGGIPAPKGYKVWREYVDARAAYEFDIHDNKVRTTITGQYMTDYLAQEALAFLNDSYSPRLTVVTPTNPHAPFWPRDDHADDWLDFVWPIVEETDVSDKPSWIQALPQLSDADRDKIRTDVIGRLQELSAVDDMVARIVNGMPPALLAETVVIFTSDNGIFQGEHRIKDPGRKAGPYEVCSHVPLIARGPGFEPGPDVTVPSLAFQDIAATLLDVGHATPGLPNQAGTSLRELAQNPDAHRDRVLHHEIGQGWGRTADGISTGPDSSLGFRKLYRYPSVRTNPAGPFVYEAYDLDTDPDEDSNWANDPARLAERDVLEAELLALLAPDPA
jgi:N-acetylglucosamine-6-sulfatase